MASTPNPEKTIQTPGTADCFLCFYQLFGNCFSHTSYLLALIFHLYLFKDFNYKKTQLMFHLQPFEEPYSSYCSLQFSVPEDMNPTFGWVSL